MTTLTAPTKKPCNTGHPAPTATPRSATCAAAASTPPSLPEPYRVGYARPGWTNLVHHLPPVRAAAALAAGLIVTTDDGRLIDRFRHRVMFPIREPDGRIAGFIGRSLSTDPTAPKYLNTPASRHLHQIRPVLRPPRSRRKPAACNPSSSKDPSTPSPSPPPPTHRQPGPAAHRHQRHRPHPSSTPPSSPPGADTTTSNRSSPTTPTRPAAPPRSAPANCFATTASTRTSPPCRPGSTPPTTSPPTADLTPYRARPAGTAIPLAAAVTEQIITAAPRTVESGLAGDQTAHRP